MSRFAVLVLAVALSVGGCAAEAPGRREAGAPRSDRVDGQDRTPTPPPDRMRVLVFDHLANDRPGRLRLVAQRVALPRATGDAALVGTLEALFDLRPARGHTSGWRGPCRPGTGVAGVSVGRAVTVTLRGSASPVCDLSRFGDLVQRQQLAWTVRATLHQDIPVRVLREDGAEVWPAGRAQIECLDPDSLRAHPELLAPPNGLRR